MSPTTEPPPCHAVDLNHSALSAASDGVSLTSVFTVRFGGPPASVSVTCAVTLSGAEIGSGNAMATTSPAPASATAQCGEGARSSTGGASARPIAPPSTPPETAASRPKITASGSNEDGQDIVIHTCDQPHSAARPNVPMAAPETAPNTTGRRTVTSSATTSTQIASK